MLLKKRKKTESIQEKKFVSARKKLSTQECGKQKKGVSHVLFKKLQSNDACHRLQTKRQPLDVKCREPPSANQA